MSSDQLTAALFERIERLEALLLAKDEQLQNLRAELEEWKAGVRGPQNRQKGRRRVRGARSAKDQPGERRHTGAGRRGPGPAPEGGAATPGSEAADD